jgi:hypoxanthine phosphoribosyltransferase
MSRTEVPEAWRRLFGVNAPSRVVYDEEQIALRVREMGDRITEHYAGREPILVLGLLKGSFIFLADLVREIRLPVHVDFIVASSYGAGRESSGEVKFLYDPGVRIQGREIVLVEDIVDSGATMNRLVPILEEREPKSLEICALLHKRRTALVKEPRWVGFDAPGDFLVGYGLDHAEDFRHLPFIGAL